MPSFTVARINQNGGTPHVELVFGYGHFAKYEIWLRKKTPPPSPPQIIGSGVNNDDLPDITPLTEPFPVLHHSVVWWQAAVADPTGSARAQYIVLVRVIQDGNVVATETKAGLLTGAPVTGCIELEVV
jgi:hypothetical protein